MAPSSIRTRSLSFALPLLLLLFLLLSLLPHSHSQFDVYTAAPSLWHTFDVEPRSLPIFAPNTTSFTWVRGFQPHEGTVLLNGVNDFIDLYLLPDDYGRALPRTLPRSVSFEWWVKWNALNTWSRILDCGNGVYADNIIVNNVVQTNDLRAAFYRSAGNSTTNQLIIAPRAVHPNTWQHVVVTIRQKNRNNNNGLTSAEIDIYIDGQLFIRQPNAQLPAMVPRINCWIGRSEWVTDQYFHGWIDDFFYYDYPIGQEEVLAHFVLPRPPVYELTFSHDPRLIQNPNLNLSYTYQWTDVDDHDPSNITQYHNGHLLLTGDMYIDLEAQSGNSSVGARPLPIIGGTNSGANGTLPKGWTIEVLFKALTVESYADLIDFGDASMVDNIILGWSYSGNSLIFEWHAGTGDAHILTVLPTTHNNTWYHVIIVMAPGATMQANTVTSYVDGNRTASLFNVPLPRGVHRPMAYVGKSPWGYDYFDAYLDTFRLYDYVLTAAEVHDLFKVTHEEMPNATARGTIVHTYHTAPVSSYTFTQRPTGLMVEGTNFRWDGTDFKFPHRGVALFNGVAEYINLAAFPSNSRGDPPPTFGGSFTVECWAMWDSFRLYSRIIDLGAAGGYAADNILLSNQGTTNNLMFEVYSGELWSQVSVTNVLVAGQWHHIIASVEQRNINDTFSASSGLFRLYVDGVERGTNLGYVPQLVVRPNAFIARSNWPGDQYFAGKMDAVYLYDYALSQEQVGAHYLVPKPPIYELAFSRDPRPWVSGVANMNAFSYVWAAFDPADFITNSTSVHNGHIVLMGDSWVNLTAASGPNSVATVLDSVLFGTGSGSVIDEGGRWVGWTLEILVKIDKQEVGAKLFDFGAGRFQDNIGMGFWDSRSRLNLYVYGGPDGTHGLAIPVIDQVQLGQWYHIVVVMKPSGSSGNGDYQVYVNGEALPPSNDYLPWPRAVPRPNCYLAKSAWWEDEFMDMYLDTFRIYDIGLTADYVQRLYQLTISNPQPPQQPLYHTGPLLSYTFDAPPTSDYLTQGTAFTWRQGSFPHLGLATFDGVTEFINLMTFPDDSGSPFPTVIGDQSFSFEAWVRWDELRQWSRIIDIANGEAGDNILIANRERTARIEFHDYLYHNGTLVIGGVASSGLVIQVGQWHHVVATLDALTKYPTNAGLSPYSAQAAWLRLFVDGSLWGEGYGPIPRAVQRTLAYLAKSHWPGDELLRGAIDSLYFYDYALSPEQINVHRMVPRPPVFDLSFDSDPRWWLGGNYNAYTYRWQEFDPTDAFANNTRYHSGHLVLDGSSWYTSYVNLSTVVGNSSVGVQLPRIGGLSNPASNTQPGWSFEVIVKLSTVGKWAKLIDWGRPAAPGWSLDNIVIGYLGDSRSLEFRVWNSLKGNDASTFVNITNVVLNQWYHFVVVVTSIGNYLDYNARYDAYVDGRLTATNGAAFFPQPMRRDSALLGRTNWIYSDDAPFAAKVDAIRVYDYALTTTYVRELYDLAHDPNAIPPSHVSSTAVPQPGLRASSSSTGTSPVRRSSSSSSAPTTAPRSSSTSATSIRRSSSSSSPAKRCQWWSMNSREFEPNCRCPNGGRYPNSCYCPDEQDGFWPYCDDSGGDWPPYDSSSTGVVPAASGPSSSLIAGVVVASLFICTAAVFVYFKYFKTQDKPAVAQAGESMDSSLLHGSTNGESDEYHALTAAPNAPPTRAVPAQTNGRVTSATGVEML